MHWQKWNPNTQLPVMSVTMKPHELRVSGRAAAASHSVHHPVSRPRRQLRSEPHRVPARRISAGEQLSFTCGISHTWTHLSDGVNVFIP